MNNPLAETLNTGCFITATDTEVGKTQITAALAAWYQIYQPERRVQVWKPVQSGARLGDPGADSHRLWRAEGGGKAHRSEEKVVTYSLEPPLAPWIAARRSEKSIDIAGLLREGQSRKQQADTLLVEGAGGWHVPLTDRETVADLAQGLQLPILLVARTGLGTVNHTLLTIESIRARGCQLAGVIMNAQSTDSKNMNTEMIIENKEMIERFGRTQVWGVFPWIEANHPHSELEWSVWRKEMALAWNLVLDQCSLGGGENND